MSTAVIRNAAEYEARLQQYYFERAEEARAVRVGEKEVSEQAAIVGRYRDLFTRLQIDALHDAEAAASGRRARTPLPAAQDVRGRRHLGGDRRTGGRPRERDPRCARHLPRRGDAVARCAGEARGARLLRRPRRARRARAHRVGRVQPRPAHAARGARAARGRRHRRSRSRCTQCGGEGDLLHELERVLVAASDATTDAYGRLRDTWFEKLLGPERDAQPSNAHVHYLRRLSPLESTYTKDAAVDICLGDDARARLRHDGDPQHPPRPRGPAAEESARLRDRVESARRRAPDHARAGRALGLPGVHARGRPRAALRRGRSATAVHVPQHLARPRADGDLLVHLRGDHARAGLACPALRALRRAGRGERAGDALPRGAALPALHGEAPLRARLLVGVRRGTRPLRAQLFRRH